MFHYMIFALACWRKEDIDKLFFMYITSFLVSFLLFLLIPYVGRKMQSPYEMYILSKVYLIKEFSKVHFSCKSLD